MAEPTPTLPPEPVPFDPRRADAGSTPPRRAGRDLPAAIAVGLGLGVLILLCLYVVKAAFVGLAVVAIGLAVWELGNALRAGGVRVPAVPVIGGAVAMLVGAYVGGAEALVAAYAVTVLVAMVWRLGGGTSGYVRDVTASTFVATYVPLLAGFAVLLLPPGDGAQRVTTYILVTVCSDIGGYAAGVLLGRHPMAPRISPKKSWEGFAGSALACVAGGVGAMVWLLDAVWWYGVVLGLAAVCSATLGDLTESMVKRDLGIKDMGTLLPGHGGLMDRLDSLLPTAPVAWLVLTLLVAAP